MKFTKIRMIWNIIIGRSVMYKMTIDGDFIRISGIKPILFGCSFERSDVYLKGGKKNENKRLY